MCDDDDDKVDGGMRDIRPNWKLHGALIRRQLVSTLPHPAHRRICYNNPLVVDHLHPALDLSAQRWREIIYQHNPSPAPQECRYKLYIAGAKSRNLLIIISRAGLISVSRTRWKTQRLSHIPWL